MLLPYDGLLMDVAHSMQGSEEAVVGCVDKSAYIVDFDTQRVTEIAQVCVVAIMMCHLTDSSMMMWLVAVVILTNKPWQLADGMVS